MLHRRTIAQYFRPGPQKASISLGTSVAELKWRAKSLCVRS
jgi:hypothetical protein